MVSKKAKREQRGSRRSATEPFERIVAEHGPTVLRLCRALVGPVDAEDAWVETFLAALKAFPRLEPGSDVKAWLVTIAYRKAVDIKRHSARGPIPVARLPDLAADASPRIPDGTLWTALARLPPRQRTAVAYHYLAGLAYQEIAAMTQSNTGAVRRAAADGIANLRKIFVDRDRK